MTDDKKAWEELDNIQKEFSRCKTCGWETDGPFSGGCTQGKCNRKDNPDEWDAGYCAPIEVKDHPPTQKKAWDRGVMLKEGE